MIEGSTPLPFDADATQAGPGTRDRDRPFYNPAMAVNRDLSVLLVEAWARRRGRQLDVADVLAGAGARSLRLAHEVDADIVVHANDGDPGAIRSIEAGRDAAGIPPGRLVAARGNAHAFLASRRFDIVDVDPYGSPAPFLDAAVRATRHEGLVCLTATDTAALAGTYPRVCRRRYGAWHGLHTMPWRAEVGLRILAAAAIRAAGRHDRAARPVLSVSRAHWMRVVLEVRDGRGVADAAARRLGFAHGDTRGMAHLRSDATGLEAPWAGPLWTGPLHDGELVAHMSALAEAPRTSLATLRLLPKIAAEADAPAFWVSMPRLHAAAGHDLPRREVLMAALQAAGHACAPSHMDPEGIRTDAPWPALLTAAAAKVL